MKVFFFACFVSCEIHLRDTERFRTATGRKVPRRVENVNVKFSSASLDYQPLPTAPADVSK
jgi:hypothetical protein